VYEVGDFEGHLFIAMAYYPGESLRARIDRGPLPIAEAVGILEQIANGLAAAHAAGIVHRDLKPPMSSSRRRVNRKSSISASRKSSRPRA